MRPYSTKTDVQAFTQMTFRMRSGVFPFVQWVANGAIKENGTDLGALAGMIELYGHPSGPFCRFPSMARYDPWDDARSLQCHCMCVCVCVWCSGK